MAGIKGKSGGQRAGAGRHATSPDPATFRLPEQAQRELRILLLNQRAIRNNSKLSRTQLLAELIHAKWLEYDAMIQQMAESTDEAPNGLD